MFSKLLTQFNKASQLQSIEKGVREAFLFCLIYASIIGFIYWVCTEILSISGIEPGAFFAYLVGCSLYVRDHLLKIIKRVQMEHNINSAPLDSVAAVIAVVLFVYTKTLYFFTNI